MDGEKVTQRRLSLSLHPHGAVDTLGVAFRSPIAISM